MSREAYQKVFSETIPYVPKEEMPGPGSYKVTSFVERLISRVRQSSPPTQ